MVLWEAKSLLLLVPLFTAAIWGLSYALAGKAVEEHSFIAFYLYEGAASILIGGIAWLFVRDPGDILSPLRMDGNSIYFFGALLASAIAGFLTLLVLKHVSPTYAAIGEVAYPLFVPVFAYLLFREKQWDTTTIIGGALIFAGLFILIYGQYRNSAGKEHVAKLAGSYIGGA